MESVAVLAGTGRLPLPAAILPLDGESVTFGSLLVQVYVSASLSGSEAVAPLIEAVRHVEE